MCVSLSVYVCFKLPLPSACGQSRRRLCTARTTLCVEPSFFLSSVFIPRAAKVTAENTYTKSTFVQTSFLWPLVVASQKKILANTPSKKHLFIGKQDIESGSYLSWFANIVISAFRTSAFVESETKQHKTRSMPAKTISVAVVSAFIIFLLYLSVPIPSEIPDIPRPRPGLLAVVLRSLL